MELTIIISYYKAIDNLKLILKALNRQSNMNFEVVVSEDDFNESTIEFVAQHSKSFNFPVTHLYQKEDNGFRKNEMLNRSVLASKSSKIVFIDGDCIPHQHFVKEYLKSIQEGFICTGRAVLLSEKISQQMKLEQTLMPLNLLNLLLSKTRNKKECYYFPLFSLSFKKGGRGIIGRNWGIAKQSLFDVNGFDTDYIHAGVGEDADIDWRLRAIGHQTKSMKNKAIVYHLYHPRTYSEEMVRHNFDLMHAKKDQNLIRCLNGIDSSNNK
jgi:glycosyltransferase involved in cell wall biosynthesis